MAAVKNGREYLSHVTESLKHRIAQLDESIEAGQKEIEGMHLSLIHISEPTRP